MAERRELPRCGRDRGGGFLEYAAGFALVAVLAGVLVAAAPGIGDAIADGVGGAMCAAAGAEDCDDGGRRSEDEHRPEHTEAALVITVDPGPGEPVQRWTLDCSPPGGTHPAPAAACAALEEMGEGIPEPVTDGTWCTMIHGGPNTASVTGSIGDTEVTEEFNRRNGCEINRWSTMGPLLNP